MTTEAQRALWLQYYRENRDHINAAHRKRWRENPKLRKRVITRHRAWRARQRAKGLKPS